MRILTDKETGEEFEIQPSPFGDAYSVIKPVKKEPRRIDWSKVNLDVVPVRVWDSKGGNSDVCYLKAVDFCESYPFILDDNCYCRASLITGKRISWGGGNCPLPEGVIVRAVMRDTGSFGCKDEARNFRWAHGGARADGDIIAFEITGIAEGWVE
jgi:hypothetical protein